VLLRIGTPLGGTSSDTNYQTTYAVRLMNTYAQLATSDDVTRQLKAKLGVKTLPDISVTIVPDSEILQILAEGGDAKVVAGAANGLADILAAYKETDPGLTDLDVLAQRKTDLEKQLGNEEQQHDQLVQTYSETTARMTVVDSALRTKEAAFQSLQNQYEQVVVTDTVSPSVTSRSTKAALSTEMANVQKELDTLNQQYSDLSQSSNSYLQQITLLRQTIQNTQSAYSNLLASYDSVSLANLKQQSAQNVVIVSRAGEPLPTTGPSRGFVIGLGVIFGVIVGIAAAFVLENLGARIPLGKLEAQGSHA
jgi:uncharacterized protein involved in exopolysaccharide biosynthesis